MLKRYESYVKEVIKESDQLLETISNPNFSIVVPGKCNGNCSFCFWKDSKPCGNYITQLKETLDSMPSQFYQLSLTGGEPTLSPYLSEILENINTEKWTHTVLTTNGTNLRKFIPQLEGKIQHINISRHHYNDKINENVFGATSVPDASLLKELVKELNDVGIDVTYSAVITEHLDNKDEIKKFIKFAKSHGVNKIFLRKQHGTLDPSNAEKAFEHMEKSHHTCPVCRNTTQHINETEVVWKASLEEPSKELGMIYEVVYNQNGVLTTDWEQEIILETNKIKEKSDYILESCGGSSSGGCGSSSGGNYSSEPTEEEIRQAELKLKKKKIKKVLTRINKQLAEDDKVKKKEDE